MLTVSHCHFFLATCRLHRRSPTWKIQGALTLQRSMYSGVVRLTNENAVDTFRMLNHKSVLYFTANWCGPCRMMKPIYEELATRHENDVTFGMVDVDENQDAALKFEIQAVPTFILFNGESAVERFSGADATRLQKLVNELAER